MLKLALPLLLLLSASPFLAPASAAVTAAKTVAGDDVTPGVATPPAVIEQIIDLGMNQSQVMQSLKELVDGIGARLTGSTNLTAAENWAADAFRELGLEVTIEPWGEVPVGFDRGPSSGALVSPERIELEFMTRSWSAGTDGPLRGPVVLAPLDEAGFEGLADSLPGAWVLSPSNWPPRPRGDDAPDDLGDDPDARAEWVRSAMGDYQAFTEARSALYASAGIAGVVLTSRLGERLLMSGNRNISWDKLPTNVRVTLIASQFEELRSRLDGGQELELEFDIDNRFVQGPVVQNNVYADLIGEIHPEQYVIVGGHLDSWDIAPGATDNGTGVTTTIEAARLLVESGAHPGRTIRFMLWGGEEQGLLGSRAWAKEHQDLMDSISAVLVHDGGTNALSGLKVTRAMTEQMEQALASVQRFSQEHPDAQPFALDPVQGLPSGASDHNSFITYGVPGFFWNQSGRADYDHTHHTQHDHYDAAIPEYQRHSAVVVALSALGIADLPEMLSRRGLTQKRRTLGVFLDGNSVSGVSSGSQAEALGVQAGDVFTSVNGEALDESRGALTSARDRGEGRKLVGWQRGEERMSGVFVWDEGNIDRDPEKLLVTTLDGESIHADYFLGAADKPASGSVVVLLPMNGADRHSWLPVRDELYAAGVATVAVDMRGHGESVGADGVLVTRRRDLDLSLYEGMVHDVSAVVKWLEARGYEAERIGLMGASVGCSIALRSGLADPRLAGVLTLTPGKKYMGLDSLAEVTAWDGRPLALVSSEEEADRGARPLHEALLGANPWSRAQLVLLEQTGIHGTQMFGPVPGIEDSLAAWWAETLSR